MFCLPNLRTNVTWKLCGFTSLSWMRVFSLALWEFDSTLIPAFQPPARNLPPAGHSDVHSVSAPTSYLLLFGILLVLTPELPGWSSGFSPSSWEESECSSRSLSARGTEADQVGTTKPGEPEWRMRCTDGPTSRDKSWKPQIWRRRSACDWLCASRTFSGTHPRRLCFPGPSLCWICPSSSSSSSLSGRTASPFPSCKDGKERSLEVRVKGDAGASAWCWERKPPTTNGSWEIGMREGAEEEDKTRRGCRSGQIETHSASWESRVSAAEGF